MSHYSVILSTPGCTSNRVKCKMCLVLADLLVTLTFRATNSFAFIWIPCTHSEHPIYYGKIILNYAQFNFVMGWEIGRHVLSDESKKLMK